MKIIFIFINDIAHVGAAYASWNIRFFLYIDNREILNNNRVNWFDTLKDFNQSYSFEITWKSKKEYGGIVRNIEKRFARQSNAKTKTLRSIDATYSDDKFKEELNSLISSLRDEDKSEKEKNKET